MGWTSKRYMGDSIHTEYPKEEAIQFVLDNFNTWGYEVKETHFVPAKDNHEHNVTYSVVKHPKGYIFALVVLIDIYKGEIFWKEMDETCGPVQAKMPKKMIDQLSPTESSFATDWRAQCLK